MAIYRKLTVANKSIIHIDYTKGSNAQNIEFEFVDYTIPVGARAFFYVRKPSGLIVYNQEEISGQKVIVKPTLQMTAEGGTNGATLAIMDGKKVLASFPIVFEIAQSYIDPEAVESTNEFDLVTQELADAIAAAERAAGSVTEAAAEAERAAGYATQAHEQADRAEAAANESAGAATAAIEARLGTKEDGTYIKADNSVAQDLKELDGGLASVSQDLTQEKSDLAQLRNDFNHFSTSESGLGNVNTEILRGECKYLVNGHMATATIEFVPLSNAVIAHDVTICTDLPHPALDLYCNDGITNCLLGVDGVLKFYYPQDTKNFTRRDFTITYMTH